MAQTDQQNPADFPGRAAIASRVCSYCGSGSELTNEHLFPKWLHEKFGGLMFSVARTASGDKGVCGELTIGDVCGACNNGALSKLDAYMQSLYEPFFASVVHTGDRVDFCFEFDRLLRWLLKTAFNLARARGVEAKTLREARSYILTGRNRPPGFRLFLQLIIPTPTSTLKWDVPPTASEIPPAPARIDFLDASQLGGLSVAFALSVNSYLFHVFKEDCGVPRRQRTWERFLKKMPGSYELTDKGRAIVYSSSLDFLTFVRDNHVFQRHLKLMKAHKDKRTKTRNSRT